MFPMYLLLRVSCNRLKVVRLRETESNGLDEKQKASFFS